MAKTTAFIPTDTKFDFVLNMLDQGNFINEFNSFPPRNTNMELIINLFFIASKKNGLVFIIKTLLHSHILSPGDFYDSLKTLFLGIMAFILPDS